MDEYFDKLNYSVIEKKIKEFDSLDFSKVSDIEIENRILDIITVDNKKYIESYLVDIPKNEMLFRIRRKYDFVPDIIENKCLNINDFLGKPNPSIGRMNRPGENGIYFSSNLRTAMLECNIKEDSYFTLAVFRNCEELDLLAAFLNNDYENTLLKENRKKAKLLNSFIYRYLLKPSKGDKNIYRITNILKKIFSEVKLRDGTLYISSKSRKDFNLHINQKSANKLDLMYVMKLKKVDDGVECINAIKVKNNSEIESYEVDENIVNSVLESDDFIVNNLMQLKNMKRKQRMYFKYRF